MPLVCLAALVVSGLSTSSQTVITFDDLSEEGSATLIASPYHGLIWSNISCNNAILETGVFARAHGNQFTNGLSGNFYGMVSPSNVAVMVPNCEIDSPGTEFSFVSAYLTGFMNSNLNIEVQGFRDSNLVYDETKVVSATNTTLFTFNYLDINRLYFISSGGEPAFGFENEDSGVFEMDNFMFEFVPEPSSVLLTALGLMSLVAVLRRKRGHH